MVERPKLGEDVIDINKGSGNLITESEFLKNIDSASFEYEKLKKANNKYLDDRMWTEAALRGETLVLADLLKQREKLDAQRTDIKTEEELKQEELADTFKKWRDKSYVPEFDDYNAINKWKDFASIADYDGYMLALSLPTLDNENKKERVDTATGYNFGEYTDREWAKEILENTFARYTAEQIEANKQTYNFLQKANAYVSSFTARVLAGASQFCQDVYNVFEGALNIFIDWGNDDDLGKRFLYAFTNDEQQPFSQLSNILQEEAFKFERDFTARYNAVNAYETGEGYDTWGRWWVGGVQSVGYMLPSMLLTAGLGSTTQLSANIIKSIGTGTFYTGIFSGNISDTLSIAGENGLTYKQLDSGEVISNALIKAGAQLAVEEVLGKIIGWSVTDKAIRGAEATTEAIKIGATEAGAFGIRAGRLGQNIIKEGLEEVFQDMSDGIIDYFYSLGKTDLEKVYRESTAEKLNIQNLIDSFVVAGLTEIGMGIVSGIKNLKHLDKSNRAIGIGAEGQTYRLGFFQTLNFNEAMSTLNEYNSILKDNKASFTEKTDAAFKMTIAIDTIGSVFANMGQDRAITANNILVGYLNDKSKKEEISKLSDIKYANDLYDSFAKAYKTIVLKHTKEEINKIKSALKEKATALKDNGVSKINNIITSEIDPENSELNLPKDSAVKFISQLKELGAIAILGTDGNMITKSKDVIVVPNDLLVKGDLAGIIKGIAYEQVTNSVKAALSPSQFKLINSLYWEITGLEVSGNEAITALLFDKNFYTKTLLMSGEHKYSSESINILATIDTIVKKGAAKEFQNGNLTNRTYQVLMNKVYETMRAGLINYATNYVNIDLDNVSSNILTKEMKDVISNHRNTIFTKSINEGIKRAKKHEVIPTDEIGRYDYYINKFADQIDGNTLASLKEKIRSKNYNDQVDAYAYLQCIAKASSYYDYTNTKLIYLSTPEEGRSIVEQNYISNFEQYFGNTIRSFADGSFDINKFTDEAKNYIETRGYNLSDEVSLLNCLTNVLYNLSNKSLTFDHNYNIIRVINKVDFVQQKYLGKTGNKLFIEDLKKGKIKTIKDIVNSKVKLPNYMKNITIDLVTSDIKGSYKDGDTFIQVGYSSTINTLMHELTHLTQYVIAKNTPKNKEYVGGGSTFIFKSLPYDVAESINKYVYENFPLVYKFISNIDYKYTYADVLYYLLEGELQANTILNTFIPNMGFKYKIVNGERYLVSPDNKETWSLASAKISGKYTIPGIIREAKAKVEIEPSDFNKIYEYGLQDPELSKTRPINEVNKMILNKYNAYTDEAINKTVELASIERTNNFSQMLKDIKAANINSFELSKTDKKLYQAGVMAIRYLAKYNEALAAWMKKAETKMKESTQKSIYQLRDELDEANISYDTSLKRSKYYVSNKEAKLSNMKYWIKKGVPIQIDPGVRDFVVHTTEGFDQLPNILKRKIKTGKLTKFDIIDYISTAANIDDFTLEHIARDVFNNEALAKISFKELRELEKNIQWLSVLAYTVDSNLLYEEMTPEQLLKLRKDIFEKAKTDSELAKKLNKAVNISDKVYLNEEQKKTRNATTVQVDDKQLNSVFFRHYNGTPASLRHINNIAKYVAAMQEYNPSAAGGAGSIDAENEAGDYGEMPVSVKDKGKVWNYIDRKRLAETVYEYDDVSKTLDILSREDKLKVVQDYITDVITAKLKSLPVDMQRAQAKAAINRLNSEIDKLNNLSDEQLDKRYLTVMEKESGAKKEIEQVMAPLKDQIKEQPKSTKNRKDQVRNLLNQLSAKIANKVSRYNALANKKLLDKLTNKNIQQFLDSETYYRNPEMYRNMTDEQLDTLIEDLKTVNQFMKKAIGTQEIRKYGKEVISKKLEKETRRVKRELREEYKAEKKTLKEKVQIDYKYKTQIKEQTFEFVTPEKANTTVEKILSTEFNKTRMSTVQGLSNNIEQDVLNGKKFFEQNVDAIMSSDLSKIEAASRWFIQAKMNNITSEEFRKYSAMKLYFLSYVLGETRQGGLYENMNANLKQQIENAIKSEVSNAGTTLAAWNNVKDLVNPLEAMKNADMELDGIKIPVAQKTEFFEAIDSNDVNKIVKAQQNIINYVASKKTVKKSILRKITSIRSMSMLSGPLTWLRNKVSNMALKRLNKISSKLGNAIFLNIKTQASQIKITKNVTPEIQEFITKNFIDNKFFDKFVSNLSKYNPSEINEKYKKYFGASGKPTKEAIAAQLVVKSLYNKYYNENMFKSKFMNSIYDKLMKVMSDDSYVREAAIRYFGKILAEKGYDFQKITEVNDNIMNDFATSVGLALSDYMHSDNFFYNIEKAISEKSDLGWFAYKLLLPYAGASWNWFKAMINMSPIGLAKSIYKITHLENEITKAEARWATGKTSINPELTEYIVRRDLGQGVIGTIAWALGMLLAGLGFIKLEDDDYGTPKIRIGNITVDISSIFGSSSLLAGAALINGMQSKGVTWTGFLEGLNNMADFTLSSFPLMEIIEMDMYTDGGFSMGMEQLEDIALSYIPNIISWIAGATYKGSVNKNTFWKRAISKIPFMANFLPKKVDIYSGEEGTWWDAANRVIPYFSYTPRTTAESKSKQLGLNKTELRGQYAINGEEFNINDKDRNTINKAYGQWNAQDLEKFYNNQMAVKVKDTKTNTYKLLSYNQMNDYQRKYAVQTIMSNNAELAKIKAWTMNGNKYYASATMYTKLTKRGVRSNVYKGNKGFVKK